MSSVTVACIPWSLKHMALAVVFYLLIGAICPASILHLLWINWCFLFLSPVLEYCLCEDNSSFLETPWSKLSPMFIHSFLLITLLLQAQERSQGHCQPELGDVRSQATLDLVSMTLQSWWCFESEGLHSSHQCCFGCALPWQCIKGFARHWSKSSLCWEVVTLLEILAWQSKPQYFNHCAIWACYRRI